MSLHFSADAGAPEILRTRHNQQKRLAKHTYFTMYWITSAVVTLILLLLGSAALRVRRRQRTKINLLQRAEDELHPLFKEYTSFRPYDTPLATYPHIRTFYRPHAHRDNHQDIVGLPLLVFIHGVGGVLPQFAPLLQSLTHIAPCFGLELPGHGRSSFDPKDYSAYTIEANVALWKTAIEEICNSHSHKQVVLIGHSLGCSIAALLASTSSTTPTLSVPVVGLISICPRIRQLSDKEIKNARRFQQIPNLVVYFLRLFDRVGGENSNSVRRVIGDSDESDLKRMQLQWNRQSRTSVVKRIGRGLLPQRNNDGQLIGGYPSDSVWQGLRAPLLLIAGESDRVTPSQEVDRIIHAITGLWLADWDSRIQPPPADSPQTLTNGLVPITIKYFWSHNDEEESIIQAIVLPRPAAHAILYAHSTYRLVAALIESFLAQKVSEKLDFSHQLRLLTTTGKWDVKNLQKWKAVLPVSAPIHTKTLPDSPLGSSNGLFRALKTMREQDDEHNPTLFLENWAEKIYAVIDISSEAPVYDAKKLDRGGVEYHKFPTVSKIPPTPLEVQDFCSLIDKLVTERNTKEKEPCERRSIAVHCHYGYNRTGFFICTYLITRCGYDVRTAVEEFAKAKPPGIRHEHFIDQLWLRYAGRSEQSPKTVGSGDEKIEHSRERDTDGSE